MVNLEDISAEEFDREARRRANERAKAYDEELRERRKRERQAQEEKDRAFAWAQRITWEQFQAVEDYVSDKIYEEQR